MAWDNKPGEGPDWPERLFPEALAILDKQGPEKGLLPAIQALYAHQVRFWAELKEALESFEKVQVREVPVTGCPVRLQFNPARAASVSAPVSAEAIKARPCFLCAANMPAGQLGFQFGPGLVAVVNPFPIFPSHLVVLSTEHRPQSVTGTLGPMLDFSAASGFSTLYNGPGSGASAPDHFHFQVAPVGAMPFENEVLGLGSEREGVFVRPGLPQRLYLLSRSRERTLELFEALADELRGLTGRSEPELNLALVPRPGMAPAVAVHPRGKHRPDCYYLEGEARRMVSPGSCDMAGLVILPRRSDFERLDGPALEAIYREVGLPGAQYDELCQRVGAMPLP
ncbi:DUF4922 domain-containing protein [bacterium]|nr:DUF4922 domain-containing protein [bacterium]